MAHTRPDYSTQHKMKTIYGEVDNAELSARLNSINHFDRRGNVFFMDDFENSLNKWNPTLNGLGAAVVISATRSRSASSSCKLTAGSNGACWAGIARIHTLPVLSSVGFECSFAVDTINTYFQIRPWIYTGAMLLSPVIEINDNDNTIKYTDDLGAQINLTTATTFRNSEYLFHTVKLVVDYNTQEYVRCIFDNTTYNMAGIPIQAAADATGSSIVFLALNVGRAANNDIVYVDDVIFTQNEPL